MSFPIPLPQRTKKPRECGITSVIDNGIGIQAVQGNQVFCDLVDMAKIAFGTALVFRKYRQLSDLMEKLEVYRALDILVLTGGTLSEIAHRYDRFRDFLKWLQELGISAVEISDGTLDIPLSTRVDYIKMAQDAGLQAIPEVGKKDPAEVTEADKWLEEIETLFDAGVPWVVLEARESGTSGICNETGSVKSGLLGQIIRGVGDRIHQVIFEAPQKTQQSWFLRNEQLRGLVGSNVNFANIPAHSESVVALEALRLGVRADTLEIFHPPPTREESGE